MKNQTARTTDSTIQAPATAIRYADIKMSARDVAFFADDSETVKALVAALETAAKQFDFTVAAMAKGQTVSISSLQNCAAQARLALSLATQSPL